ncbi:hypothetical protein E4P82_01845 [Candidatus Competibacter phosphatis]|uniref:Uncharacterized protein n=1 Tax=Candidatus Competibacter phosphatis TaxID=221280 RepID=A0ABX1TH86_9GAMM|nr:hypothetical protein [Candidatus Competibacter phosphatis]NMQ18047.1 hypothetical protein [Candidatus Competibacter phosphatis]
MQKPYNHLQCGRFAPALRGGGLQSAGLIGTLRRTTTRIKPTSAVKAFGFSGLAAYPPSRYALKIVIGAEEVQEWKMNLAKE